MDLLEGKKSIIGSPEAGALLNMQLFGVKNCNIRPESTHFLDAFYD